MRTSEADKRPARVERLKLSQIVTDAGTQSRARMDEATAAEYAARMIAGDPFPPVTVFQDRRRFFLADGFHRVRGAKLAKLNTILAEVRQGTRTDALRFSLASNHSHGLRRTNEDKQYAVTLALRELAHLSDRLIAELCGVSHPVVGQLRRQLVKFTSSDQRTGKDGKLRRLPNLSEPEAQSLEVTSPNGHDRADIKPDLGQPVYTAVVGDNADLIYQVARLYLPPNAVLGDLTYGQGAWWSKVNLAGCRFFKSDLTTRPTAAFDFRKLPYPDGYFDVVAFDPPYMHNPSNPMVEPRYANAQTTRGLYHEDIIKLYAEGMREAKRVLKPGGMLWVKTADEVESAHQRRSHIEIHGIAMKLGLIDEDLFLLVRTQPPVIQFHQVHARKNHSFLWIFRKPGSPVNKRRG